jgi:cathepsin B
MVSVVLLAAFAAVALAGGSLRITEESALLTEEEVAMINSLAGTWRADYNLVKGMTKEEARARTKTILRPSTYPKADWGALLENFQAPNGFDTRDWWPNCVNYIREQQGCGSCWAFGASEALSDRYCIRGSPVLLSPQYQISCDSGNGGCQGGYIDAAWRFLESTGIPSDYCVSYKSGAGGDSGTCPSTCDDGSYINLYRATNVRSFTDPASIQIELFTNGPIEVGFWVYEDFMAYAGGIYQHTYGSFLGGHAVKLVGWGEENGLNYWICANSWGTGFGEGGYFRIAWGTADIEAFGTAGVPAI